MRETHTYVRMELSRGAYQEIRSKMIVAGYEDALNGDDVDMHGIAVVPKRKKHSPLMHDLGLVVALVLLVAGVFLFTNWM